MLRLLPASGDWCPGLQWCFRRGALLTRTDRATRRYHFQLLLFCSLIINNIQSWLDYLFDAMSVFAKQYHTDVWKILESACMNSWRPRAQRVNFALFGAHSRKYMRGLWSENVVTSVAKTKFLNFRKWVKWALIPIFFSHVCNTLHCTAALLFNFVIDAWLGSRVVSLMDSGAEGPGFKSQSRRCRVTVLGKLFTPIVPLFTKQRNW